MMARFDDPFFRFYGLLPTFDKGLPMQRLIRRFKESSQFIRLRKQMRKEFFDSDFPDIDEDENVLIRSEHECCCFRTMLSTMFLCIVQAAE